MLKLNPSLSCKSPTRTSTSPLAYAVVLCDTLSTIDEQQKYVRTLSKVATETKCNFATANNKIENILPKISSKNVLPKIFSKNIISRISSKNVKSSRASNFEKTVRVLNFLNVPNLVSNFPNVPKFPNVPTVSIHGEPSTKPSTVPSTKPTVLIHGEPSTVPSIVAGTKPSKLVHRQRVASLVTKQQQQPLRPCWKRQVNINSQSLQYQKSLPTRTKVSFGIITLPQTQTQQLQAYRAQNTIIDSYKVAMEIHEQHQYAAIDSGASSHFYPTTYDDARHDPTAATIHVRCANKSVMKSLAEDIIYFDKMPLAAKKCHKFNEIWLPLLSV